MHDDYPTIRPILRDAPVPEGANVLGSDRAGRAIRDRYVAHLNDLHAREYLTLEELHARENAALEAVTMDQLRVLLRDLPPLPSPPVHPDRWKDKKFYVPALLGGIVASILVAVSPFAILGLLGLQKNSALMTPLGVASILTGIVGALACGITLVVKLEDHS